MKRLFSSLLAILVLLAVAAGVLAADPLLRETWVVAEQDGRPVGYGCDRCWRTEDGFRYRSEGTLRLSLLGGAPSEIVTYLEADVDRDYHAKSFRAMITVNGALTEITGRLGPSGAEVTFVTPDGREQTSFYQTEEPLYFDFSFLDSIVAAGGLKPGTEYAAAVFDFATFAPADYLLRVEGLEEYRYGEETLKLFALVEKTGGKARFLMDGKANIYWESDPKSGLVFRRVEKDRIPALEAMSADVLLVPGNVKVLHPFRSLASTIRVSWQDVPFAAFNWEDNRQKLVAHRETPEGQEVVLAIARDGRDFTGKVTLPVTGEEFAPYLQDADYITPSLPEIKARAREILGEEKDGWAATKKLVKWVYEFIAPAMIPETLTTAQILAKKQGKCAEYAILFAALARAAGLPTRVVLGERYQGNVWVGHLWNEVWLGEWVAVDPSHNQFAPDALLLKFVHSASVMGTQKVRYGLIGQLGIGIEKVEMPAENAIGEARKTGIEGQKYVNAEFGCAIAAPDDWKMMEASEQDFPMLVMAPASVPGVAGILFLTNVPTGTRSEQLLTARLPNLLASLPNAKVLGQEKGTLAELEATKAVLTFTAEEKDFYREEWIAVQEDRCYLLIFMAPAERWEALAEEFRQIKESFAVF
ncbi:MAG: transglutaminase-like domain-containing protein [Bacillota bacterium]